MSDSWEAQYWDILSPINEQDADDDPDGDRYMNFEEFIRSTVPNNPLSKPTPLTFYVDNDAPFDPCANNPDISDPWEDGSSEHPFDAFQEGLNAGDEVEFTFLRNALKLSDGNLSVQIRKLEEAGCIKVKKVFVERKPKTFCKITAKGRKAILCLLRHLENLVR